MGNQLATWAICLAVLVNHLGIVFIPNLLLVTVFVYHLGIIFIDILLLMTSSLPSLSSLSSSITWASHWSSMSTCVLTSSGARKEIWYDSAQLKQLINDVLLSWRKGCAKISGTQSRGAQIDAPVAVDMSAWSSRGSVFWAAGPPRADGWSITFYLYPCLILQIYKTLSLHEKTPRFLPRCFAHLTPWGLASNSGSNLRALWFVAWTPQRLTLEL